LGKSQDVIRRYLSHGNDSVLLANLIHITRTIFNSSSGITRDMAGDAASYILRLPSEFDIRRTLPELKRDFCALWNDIVSTATGSGDSSIPHFILYLISIHFIKLHEGTGDARTAAFDEFKIMSYPPCNDPDQHTLEMAGTPPPPAAHTNNTISVPSQQVDGASTAPQHVTITASDSPLSATMPDPSAGGLYSSAGSLINESDRPPPGRTSSSSSQIANAQVDPQIRPASNPSDNTAIAVPRVHEDTRDRNISTQPELPSELSLPDIVITIPEHADWDPSENPSSG
jgi:hypothetical protein